MGGCGVELLFLILWDWRRDIGLHNGDCLGRKEKKQNVDLHQPSFINNQCRLTRHKGFLSS
jgi:hypothetical protein